MVRVTKLVTPSGVEVELGPLSGDLRFLARNLHVLLRGESLPLRQSMGVDVGAAAILSVVWLNPGISQNDLAAAIVLITMCLGVLGIQVHTIVAVIGAAGAAIALALKDSLANIAGGVMIILTKPFSKDDLIDIGDVSGKVHHIDLFLTTLKTYDNKTITIPNGIVNTSVLVNHSQEEKRRVDCTFGIGYDDDIEHAKEIMRKVCDDNPLILTDPQPLIGVANHGESSVDMDLKAWCLTEHYWDVKYYLEEHIKVAFDENGIQIPFPQMDVHIHHE